MARLDIQIFCGDVKEKVIGEDRQILDLELDEETYQRYLTSGIPFSTRVAFNGDPVHVKILVYDFAADLIGTTYVKLGPGL